MNSEHSGALDTLEAKAYGPLPRIRPLTLLAACGITLAAALLIVTGLVLGYLREQTMAASEAGLAQLDAVLTEAADQALHNVDAMLGDIAGRLRLERAAAPREIVDRLSAPETGALLTRRIEASPSIAGVALIGADGAILNRAGAWPQTEQNIASRDYFVALSTHPELGSFIGMPIPAASDPDAAEPGGWVIPVARALRDADGGFAGLAIGVMPVRNFNGFYRAVPLSDDGTIALVRRDGVVLSQYPVTAVSADQSAFDARVAAMLREGGQGLVENERSASGRWRIASVRLLADYPIGVVVSRDGDQALVAWSRQAEMFGAFVLFGIAAIALMMVLIGRQLHTHGALAAIRAEKMEIEHARLFAEAELLKKERLSVLGQFTATVANELRNPLSAIRNTLFTMREIAVNSGLPLDRPIARIQRSIGRCDRIIGDLMEYIRSPELSRVSVSFDRWLRDLLAEHSLPPAVMLIDDCRAGEAVVRIDADRIRRVVINLIDNAAQALGEVTPGSGALRLTVRSAVVGDHLEFSVSDTGPGIPAENMARIFEPLFSTRSFGAGLGLATVKQIVVQHGGTIDVDSAVGRGTAVTIRLPLEQILKLAA